MNDGRIGAIFLHDTPEITDTRPSDERWLAVVAESVTDTAYRFPCMLAERDAHGGTRTDGGLELLGLPKHAVEPGGGGVKPKQ